MICDRCHRDVPSFLTRVVKASDADQRLATDTTEQIIGSWLPLKERVCNECESKEIHSEGR